MKVVLAGGSGLLGTALTASLLADSHEVVVLSRSPGGPDGARVALWDGKGLGEWAAEVDGADAVVNLSGYPVFSRWDKRTRGRILNSRVDTTRAVGEAIQAADQPPNVWVNLSAIGFYGDTGERRVDESDPAGRGFMAETCAAWEEACLSGNPSPGAQRSGGGRVGASRAVTGPREAYGRRDTRTSNQEVAYSQSGWASALVGCLGRWWSRRPGLGRGPGTAASGGTSFRVPSIETADPG